MGRSGLKPDALQASKVPGIHTNTLQNMWSITLLQQSKRLRENLSFEIIFSIRFKGLNRNVAQFISFPVV